MSIKNLARADLFNSKGYSGGQIDKDSIRLNSNENPWAPEGALDSTINRYPDRQPDELLNRLSQTYEVPTSNMLVTRGADDGIDALIRSFCQPGIDSIVQCPPAFVMYSFFARLQNVLVLNIPLKKDDGFAVDFHELTKLGKVSVRKSETGQARSMPKIYFVCSPNNPTGTTVDSKTILEFAKRVQTESLVVVDEAYVEFSQVASLASTARRSPNLVVLRTLSKAWSLAGARLGVVIANDELINYLKATTSPYPLSKPAVSAALQAMMPEQILIAKRRIQQLVQLRNWLAVQLQRFDFVVHVFPSDANFLLVKVLNSSRLLRHVRNDGLVIRDQSEQLGLSNCLRISIGTQDDLRNLLASLSKYNRQKS